MSASTLARAALILGCGLVACSRSDRTNADSSVAATPTPAPTTDSAAGSVGGMSESQIVDAVMAANTMDSANGAAAVEKASNPEVKEFARTMVRDHGALNKQVADLAGRLNVMHSAPPAPGAMSATEGLTGSDYDRAYIDGEITMHQDVVTKLDRDLIPSATNAELRTLLQQARGNVQGHLDRALQLKETLAKLAK